MEDFINLLLIMLAKYGLPTLLIFCAFVWVALYWYRHEGSLERFLLCITKVLQIFRIGYNFLDKKRIKFSYESALKQTINEVSTCSLTHLGKYPCKLEWIDSDEAESCLKNGTVFVRVKQTKKKQDNLVMLIYLYISATLIPELKKILSTCQKDSLDFFITYLVVLKLDRFYFNSFNRIFTAQIEDNKELKRYYEAYHDIYVHGYFTPIFLHEIQRLEDDFAIKIDMIDIKTIHQDIDMLIELLQSFCHRYTGTYQIEPWEHNGAYIKMFIVIFAKHEKLENTAPHIAYIKKAFDKGLRRGYISSQAHLKEYINNVCNELEECCHFDTCYDCDALLHKSRHVTNNVNICVTVLEKKRIKTQHGEKAEATSNI